MDTMPPQAPPALTTTVDEAAIATVQRIAEAQAWIVAQEAALPAAPAAATADDLDAYLTSLDGYWESAVPTAPGLPALARHDALAARLSALMTDDAELLGMDGTMDRRAVALATTVSRSHGGVLPATVHAHELLIGDVAYAGALVVTDDTAPGFVLMFSPTAGWRTFPDLATLEQTTELIMRDHERRQVELPGVAPIDLARVIDGHFVSTRPLAGDLFGSMVQRMRQVQEDRVEMAWLLGTFRRSDAQGATPALLELESAVIRAAALHPHIDIAAMIGHRDAALRNAIVATELAAAPEAARIGWRTAYAVYQGALARADAQRRDEGLGEPVSLEVFTRRALKGPLSALGIDDDPGQMTVDIYPAPALVAAPGDYVHPIERSADPFEPLPETLLETTTLDVLAQRNVPESEKRIFRVRGADGRDLSNALPPRQLEAMLRRVDIGGAYRAELTRELDKSYHGKRRRDLAKRLTLARMSLELESTRIGDWQPDATRNFIEDREERGYRWARAVLDHALAGTAPRYDGHALSVSQVVYQGHAVKDVFLIEAGAPGQPKAVPNVVLYTPEAPDGRDFREYDNVVQAEERFLHDGRFQAYLLDRLPPQASEPAPDGAGRRFRQSHAAGLRDFALNRGRPFGTRTEEPFRVRPVGGKLLDAWYDATLAHLDASVAVMARTAGEADADAAFRVDPEAIARAVSGFIGRPFQASWRAYDAIRAGDHAGAFVDITEAYATALDAGGLALAAPVLARPILIRAATTRSVLPGVAARPKALISSGVTLPEADLIAEPRFLARGVRLRDATASRDGIHTIGGKPYIRSGPALYAVRRDETFHVWRLARHDGTPLTSSSPLARTSSGRWIVDDAFGLPGGAPSGRGTPGAASSFPSPPVPPAAGAAGGGAVRIRQTTVDSLAQVLERVGPANFRRLALSPAVQTPTGSASLLVEWLNAEELMAIEASLALRRARAAANTPGRPGIAATPRHNAPRPVAPRPAAPRREYADVPVEHWPNQFYAWVDPAALVPEGGIVLPHSPNSVAAGPRVAADVLSGMHVFRVLPRAFRDTPVDTRGLAGGSSVLSNNVWVRIDMNAIARRLHEPAYAGFRVTRVVTGALDTTVLNSGDSRAVRILFGDYNVIADFPTTLR